MVASWGMIAETAGDGLEALRKLADFSADVILTDLNMPGLDGFGFLQRLQESGEMPPTIVLTAYGNIETAVKTVHELGAYWFLEKPIQPRSLEVLIRRAGNHAVLRAEKRNLERQLGYKGALGELVGTSPKMQEIFALLQQAGPSKACVLITGESGTGKELIARTLHALSGRRNGPFVAINCAALPETLIESELFGHEKGSFTGASERTLGVFREAEGGTLFLDEIGELPLPLQVKLLRVLQERKVRPVGGAREIPVDVRVLSATNRDIEADVQAERFRQDLYYRINVIRLELPALRERREDIPFLAEAFLERFSAEQGKEVRGLTPDAHRALVAYDFPGNVRELENMMERGVALSGSSRIGLGDLPPAVSGLAAAPGPNLVELPADGCQLDDVVSEVERRLVVAALERTGGVRTHAARLLGISFRSLRYRLQKHALEAADDAEEGLGSGETGEPL